MNTISSKIEASETSTETSGETVETSGQIETSAQRETSGEAVETSGQAKSTRYSDQDTEFLERSYREGKSLEEIAEVLNRTVRSARAKLASLGLYKRQPYLNKNGEVPKNKAAYVKEIALILDVDESLVDSLEKCTKFTLKTLLEHLREQE